MNVKDIALTDADEAVQRIQPGDRVFVGTGCAMPTTLVQALEDLETMPAGVTLVHFVTSGNVPEIRGEPWTRFRHLVFFVGTDTKEFVRTGKSEYVPISLAEVPALLATGRLRLDVALVQTVPPDDSGRCSLGVSVDVTRAAVEHAGTVIAELNPNMPRTRGRSSVPAASIAVGVPVDTPVIEYLHEPVGPAAEQIARYVARLVGDGATLQIGLGRIPTEMLTHLANRRDLGIHSDVVTEPLVDLVEEGVVTGARKSVHHGECVTSWCMGTKRLYDLVDDNPAFSFQPIEYVADPQLIARNHRMVSVTQAFAIDLTGQVCADQFDGELYGGVSTQPEFHRGAAAAPGGKAIVCTTAMTADGRQSRIRPQLRPGEAVAIPRAEVRYVVTEFGIAYLFGKTLRERAVSLIEIAHPDVRAELLEVAVAVGLVPEGQTLRSRRDYPVEEERRVTLRNGREVLIRPTRATDAEALQDLFYRLPPKDVYTRFFTNLRSLSTSMAEHLTSVDYAHEMAFAAVVGDWEDEQIIASSCYYLDPATNLADVAYMVDPKWQGIGLGGTLQETMIDYARSQGIRGFTADVLTTNTAMLSVFERSGCDTQRHAATGAYEVTLLFH